jgi:hypothetical protein
MKNITMQELVRKFMGECQESVGIRVEQKYQLPIYLFNV